MIRDKHILWRCRRGTKELDLVLQAYAERVYPYLESGGRKRFVEFLESEDAQLIEWLVYGQPSDPRFRQIVEAMLQLMTSDQACGQEMHRRSE